MTSKTAAGGGEGRPPDADEAPPSPSMNNSNSIQPPSPSASLPPGLVPPSPSAVSTSTTANNVPPLSQLPNGNSVGVSPPVAAIVIDQPASAAAAGDDQPAGASTAVATTPNGLVGISRIKQRLAWIFRSNRVTVGSEEHDDGEFRKKMGLAKKESNLALPPAAAPAAGAPANNNAAAPAAANPADTAALPEQSRVSVFK